MFGLELVGLEPMSIKVKPLKFDDKEIREHISSFAYLDKEGNIKQKKRSFTPINVPKKSRYYIKHALIILVPS